MVSMWKLDIRWNHHIRDCAKLTVMTKSFLFVFIKIIYIILRLLLIIILITRTAYMCELQLDWMWSWAWKGQMVRDKCRQSRRGAKWVHWDTWQAHADLLYGPLLDFLCVRWNFVKGFVLKPHLSVTMNEFKITNLTNTVNEVICRTW